MLSDKNSNYLQGIIEADSGYLGDMDIKDTLTMGNSGKITNSSSDYLIDKEGVNFNIPDDSLDLKRSVTWKDGNTTKAQIGAYYDTQQYFSSLEYDSSNHIFKVDSNVILQIASNLVYCHQPPVVPRITKSERNNLNVPTGSIIFNTDDNVFQGKDKNGTWVNFNF